MQEQKLIEIFSRVHGTRPFGADAEVVPFDGTNLLVTTDSFSEREDFLSGLEPEAMGRVMAYGAIADILACGVKPDFLVQAWNIDDSHDERFYERVAHGVQQVVSHYGAKVIGGDIGSAKEWCWTATVFASCKTPVRRIASRRVDFDLYAMGFLGAANVAAFLGRPVPEPALHDPVPGNALFATDTSGGLFDALENFRRVNPGVWLWSLVGGVGEYELVFAVPVGTSVADAVKIGRGGFAAQGACDFRIMYGGKIGRMSTPPPDYRSIPRENWLTETASYWTSLWR